MDKGSPPLKYSPSVLVSTLPESWLIKVPHRFHSVMSQARPESMANGHVASAGFWRHDGPLGYGKLCFACPDGAECPVLFLITFAVRNAVAF